MTSVLRGSISSVAQNHFFTYDEPIKVESVTQSVSDLALRFGEGANEEEASMVSPLRRIPRRPR